MIGRVNKIRSGRADTTASDKIKVAVRVCLEEESDRLDERGASKSYTSELFSNTCVSVFQA
jgi:hypothetical protein